MCVAASKRDMETSHAYTGGMGNKGEVTIKRGDPRRVSSGQAQRKKQLRQPVQSPTGTSSGRTYIPLDEEENNLLSPSSLLG